MKALFAIMIYSLLAFPVSVFGQRSKLSQVTPSFRSPALKVEPKAEIEISSRVFRDLEEKFSSKAEHKDFIALGIRSIENNFDRPNALARGISWKPDADSTIRLRKTLTYKYDPRVFPKDPVVSIKKAFVSPVENLVMKALAF